MPFKIPTNLIRANLSQVDGNRAVLRNADLRLAELQFTDLSQASLAGANLSYANLTGVNLAGVNLSHTQLAPAIVVNVNWSGVILHDVDLTQIDMSLGDFRSIVCPKDRQSI